MPTFNENKDLALEFVYKTLMSAGHTSPTKKFFEEAIQNRTVILPGSLVWNEDNLIPGTPPVGSTGQIEVVADLTLTLDPTVPDNKVFVAATTPGDFSSARLADWIPVLYGQGYQVKIYEDDGIGGLGNQIFTADPIDWIFFDYGVLVCLNDPVAAGKQLPLHVVGCRYIGNKGIPTAAAVDLNDTFTLASPGSDTWNIPHGLGKYPSVLVKGKASLLEDVRIIEPADIEYVDDNELNVYFADAIFGTAYLN